MKNPDSTVIKHLTINIVNCICFLILKTNIINAIKIIKVKQTYMPNAVPVWCSGIMYEIRAKMELSIEAMEMARKN